MIIPPIKSNGIKTKLVPFIKNKIPNATTLIEPFFGTGVVSFNAGIENVIANDINPHIINFYQSVKSGEINENTARTYLEYEGKKLEEDGVKHYNLVRKRFNEIGSSLDFLFLTRACFNGLMRFNSKGGYNTPYCKKDIRFSKAYITKICNQIKNLNMENYSFYNKDFREIINLTSSNAFIYCDPPYMNRNNTYFIGWNEKDESDLADMLSSTSSKFMLSTWHHNKYRNNEMIDKYWNKFNIITVEHRYTIGGKEQNRKNITEALITNF